MQKDNNQFLDNITIESQQLRSNSISIEMKGKIDSGFSSIISQRSSFIRTSSPIVIQGNNNKTDSPGTSYSSRNSTLMHDDELEEIFPFGLPLHVTERNSEKLPFKDFDCDSDVFHSRHSVRNSPWTVRPDSTLLREEDEDLENEASDFAINPPHESPTMSGLPELIQCCTLQCNRIRFSSYSESEQRNEMIACKLREIADKLDSSNKVRTRNHSTNSDSVKSTPNRRSRSSFADIAPCCGSAVDLFLSLYNAYKFHHSEISHSASVVSSQSVTSMSQVRQRMRSRTRFNTQ